MAGAGCLARLAAVAVADGATVLCVCPCLNTTTGAPSAAGTRLATTARLLVGPGVRASPPVGPQLQLAPPTSRG